MAMRRIIGAAFHADLFAGLRTWPTGKSVVMLQKAPVPDWRSTEKKAALEIGSRNENDELENEKACTLKKRD
jgi:hypothetical protein